MSLSESTIEQNSRQPATIHNMCMDFMIDNQEHGILHISVRQDIDSKNSARGIFIEIKRESDGCTVETATNFLTVARKYGIWFGSPRLVVDGTLIREFTFKLDFLIAFHMSESHPIFEYKQLKIYFDSLSIIPTGQYEKISKDFDKVWSGLLCQLEIIMKLSSSDIDIYKHDGAEIVKVKSYHKELLDATDYRKKSLDAYFNIITYLNNNPIN